MDEEDEQFHMTPLKEQPRTRTQTKIESRQANNGLQKIHVSLQLELIFVSIRAIFRIIQRRDWLKDDKLNDETTNNE